jgi:cytochrome c oxidase accessory protein FixG
MHIQPIKPEQTVSTTALYADHVKIYPQRIWGRFRVIKWSALSLLLGIYYLAPWLRWDRGPGRPDQALLLDMPGRRGYFFWIEIWPQEVYYLAGLLILGAIGLFLATSLLGRVWCGFTCPQTVWTDLFMQVERWIEGDRNARMKLDKEPFSLRKAWLKTAKHGAWLVIAALTGGAWIMYFNDAPTLVRDLVHFDASLAQVGFIGLFTATTYLLAGWAREQVCIYMCPWPRFQGAMLDEHSLIVTYEAWRGEPRGKKKAKETEKLGDCVDCNLCFNVCPTGVDIRNGPQLACIGCGLCVDACNSIMGKLGRPLELITYDSLSNSAARAAGKPAKFKFIRTRTVIYAVGLVLVTAGMLFSLSTRATMDVTVQADRSPLFVKLGDGEIQDGFTLKISNKNPQPMVYRVAVEGIDGLSIKIIGADPQSVKVGGDSVGTFRLLLKAPRENLEHRRSDITISAVNITTGEESRHGAIFNGPKHDDDD